MVTTVPPPEMAVEKPQARLPNESSSGTNGRMRRTLAENNGSAELASSVRRGKRRHNARGSESPSPVQRFFLTKTANGIPELGEEVEDENTAMVEALKMGTTYIILSEWRPTVDNTTKGRPLITKEAVSVSKNK